MCIFCGKNVSDLGTQVCAECKSKLEAFDIGLNHSKKDCIKNAVWSNGELRCAKCGRLIALAYKIDNQICVFKLPHYKKCQIDLSNPEISFVSELSYSDFDEYISELKKELFINIEDQNGDDFNLV